MSLSCSPSEAAGRRVRPLTVADLPDLLAVQRACYGDGFEESREVFARRLASPANCSLALELAGRLCGYLAAYRSRLSKVTPLHGDFEAVDAPDTLYLHDMAVHPDAAGQGLARALLQPLWERARAQGLRHTALVSVQGSRGYWERHGYAAHPLTSARQRQHLDSYGPDALYMARHL
ncbi:GNAT family N-acetyltransferase [Delftia sp. PS-11]|uniref:GNAT family N-acetyltransferase n=1 Tax=Delftia sp. PS-11 TaxID=2767222 RepID=UPI0024575C24|nr:N-acetyltransferase [Delftia sp. PS-11]KAJ8743212.1 GNAT family N-acetyltransferase [Delftia sp. PS-11]